MSSGGLWRRTLVYLGLVEEPEEYDDLPERFDDQGAPAPPPAGAPQAPAEHRGRREVAASNVRALRVPEPGSPHVRAVEGSAARVAIVQVTEFDDVEQVGARFRTGSPVVVDLRRVDTAVARRTLDFVSGMTYALRGRLVPAGSRAYLVAPEGLELGVDERRRLDELGYGIPGSGA